MPDAYRHFTTAVFCTARDVTRMRDEAWRDRTLADIQRAIHLDKVYIETYRSQEEVSTDLLAATRDFFEAEGIATAGALTTSLETTPEWDFRSMCFSTDRDRVALTEATVRAASVFDEIIFDDFFFTNCTCEACVTARGDRSWSQFRLEQMRTVAEDLIMAPARAANPRVKVVVKYPNWYEHFAFSGYNLELGSTVFDGAYTGTETRDATHSTQHLPPYLGFGIVRYYEHLHPGRNGGGWVDPFQRGTLDRYGEQLRLTALARAREITLFCWGVIADWFTEFDSSPDHHHVVDVAGREFAAIDPILGKLGTPIGLLAYRPAHTTGEDYLHHHLGTMGIPVDMTPHFPASGTVLLTEGAAADAGLVGRIETHLRAGNRVVVTSGLLRAIGDDFQALASVRVSDRAATVDTFTTFADVFRSSDTVTIPVLTYATNTASEVVSALHGESGFPILTRSLYGAGTLHVLTIPDDPTDLYLLPREIGTALKAALLGDQLAHLESAPKVGLFLYDNDTLVINTFTDHPTQATLVVHRANAVVTDLVSGEVLASMSAGEHVRVPLNLFPRTYRALRVDAFT